MDLMLNKWISLLFTRFKEIYGEDCTRINQSHEEWGEALSGLSSDQIKQGLIECRVDTSVLPSPLIFAGLCKQQRKSVSDNCNKLPASVQAATINPKPGNVIPLQWSVKSLESPVTISNNQQKEWQQKLLIMDEATAMAELTHEQRYDRNRLLMEKLGREQVCRLQALVSDNKPVIKRKDWE